ncbi:MAG: hypothetical protein O7G83_01320, partial [Proteobacteria bacterium]|nr:hypothetical protein [Pseudomonadota bacterium]
MTTGTNIVLVSLLGTAPVDAKVTQIIIERTTSPAFEGAVFDAAGQYEVIAGRAYGELDPSDEHNA